MCDEAEVGQAALDAWVQYGNRPGVAQWTAILGQEVCKLLADLPEFI